MTQTLAYEKGRLKWIVLFSDDLCPLQAISVDCI